MGVRTGDHIPTLSLRLHARICRQSLTYLGCPEERLLSCSGTRRTGRAKPPLCFHPLESSAQIGLWKLQELLHLLSDGIPPSKPPTGRVYEGSPGRQHPVPEMKLEKVKLIHQNALIISLTACFYICIWLPVMRCGLVRGAGTQTAH